MGYSITELQDRLNQVNERLAIYYNAEKAILAGQSYKIGTRALTRANLKEVLDQIAVLEKQRHELEIAIATGIAPAKRKTVRVLFRDL